VALSNFVIKSSCGGTKQPVSGSGTGPYSVQFNGMFAHDGCRINATFDRSGVFDAAGNQLPSGGPMVTVWFGASRLPWLLVLSAR
jgi:hypothetical protein